MKPIRVIVVDDSLFFLQAAIAFLSRQESIQLCGHTLKADQTSALAARHSAELVIIDLSMPGMNGIEVTTMLKQQPQAPKVLIVSLHDSPAYREAATRAGADAFLPKGQFADSLHSTLDRLFPGRAAVAPAPQAQPQVI
jgi:DNA-binding NarL/FixJ family response regulator